MNNFIPTPYYSVPNYFVEEYTPIPLTGDEDDDIDPRSVKVTVPMYGNLENFNMNSLLHNNIIQSEYFRALYQLVTYHEVLYEIKASVTHLEPWQTGTSRIPSSAFCLLLKLLIMKLTMKQLKGVLEYSNCPYVRGIGFLYLRYTCPPNDLWSWFEPYIEDEEELLPSPDKSIKMTVGRYCVKLLTDMSYFGTTLPRIPIPVERKLRVLMMLLEQKAVRRNKNLIPFKEGLFQVNTPVRAIYSDAENEPAWYDAVITSMDEADNEKFWVTFTEYGNSECVSLGEIDLKNYSASSAVAAGRARSRSRSRSRGRKDSRSRSRDRDRGDRSDYRGDRSDRDRDREKDRKSGEPENLMEKVLESSRQASTAVGKNYAQRPASYKGSLSLKMDRFTVRRKSPSKSPDRERRDKERERMRERERERDRHRDNDHREGGRTMERNTSMLSHSSSSSQLKESSKLKILKDRYGDASAK